MTATATTLPMDPTEDLGEPAETLTYPISTEYVKSWSLVRALAEAVSNAIDADPDNFLVSYNSGDQELVIEDTAEGGVGAEGMVFGWSDKISRTDVIGQFGEGLKIATIRAVSDSKVRYMLVETVGYSFVPVVSEQVTALGGLSVPRRSVSAPKVLTWRLYPSIRSRGTVVRIGVPQKIAQEMMARFRHITTPGYESPSWPGMVVPDEPGRVYIGGVYVKDNPDLLFGYDLALEAAKRFQNRDRTVVDNYALGGSITDILATVDDVDLLSRIVEAALAGTLDEQESHVMNVASSRFTYATKAAWREAGQRVLGDVSRYFYREESYFQSDAEEDALNLLDRGYEEIRNKGLRSPAFNALMSVLGVKRAKERKQESRSRTRWSKNLRGDEQRVLDDAVDLFRKAFGRDFLDTVQVYDSVQEQGHLCSFDGYYEPRSGMVAIARNVLSSQEQTRQTLFHEGAHRVAHRRLLNIDVYDYTDRSRGFETALGILGSRLLDYFATGISAEDLDSDRKEDREPPIQVQAQFDLPLGMSWVGQDATGRKPMIEQLDTATEAQRLINAALIRWARDNGVPHRSRYAEFARARFMKVSVVRKIAVGAPGRGVPLRHVNDIAHPLGLNGPALWWALVGGQQVWRHLFSGSTNHHRFRAPEKNQALTACDLLDAQGGAWATISSALRDMAEGRWEVAPESHSDHWAETLRDAVRAAVEESDVSESDMEEARATDKPGDPNAVTAWRLTYDA